MMCKVLFSLARTHFGPSGVCALHKTKCPQIFGLWQSKCMHGAPQLLFENRTCLSFQWYRNDNICENVKVFFVNLGLNVF
jgi:hypothetical protein